MNFDAFYNLIKVFHPQSSKDEKYEYLFKIYDFDEVKHAKT